MWMIPLFIGSLGHRPVARHGRATRTRERIQKRTRDIFVMIIAEGLAGDLDDKFFTCITNRNAARSGPQRSAGTTCGSQNANQACCAFKKLLDHARNVSTAEIAGQRKTLKQNRHGFESWFFVVSVVEGYYSALP